jgi:hypothetical protein
MECILGRHNLTAAEVVTSLPRRRACTLTCMIKERVTPDGRYFVVRGRLWRRTNPDLPVDRRATLVRELMNARLAVKAALRSGVAAELALARKAVDEAKVALGERGPVWWTDGAPDLTRHKVKDSPYAEWYQQRGEL